MPTEQNKIRLGLPKGSLNHPDRGPTFRYLQAGELQMIGYDPGKESLTRARIKNYPTHGAGFEIDVFVARPEDMPRWLSEGLLDLAITGEDWVREQTNNGTADGIIKVGDLMYGKARIVIAVPEDAPYNSLTEFFDQRTLKNFKQNPVWLGTEYVGLAEEYIRNNAGYQRMFLGTSPIVDGNTGKRGDNSLVRIVQTYGGTEVAVKLGADLIADVTQTGDSLRANRLRELEEIMKTSAGLYAAPETKDWIMEEARSLHKSIQGGVIAEDYAYLAFNLPNENIESCAEYLVDKGLCAKAPDVSPSLRTDNSTMRILTPRDAFPSTIKTLQQKYEASDFVKLSAEWVAR